MVHKKNHKETKSKQKAAQFVRNLKTITGGKWLFTGKQSLCVLISVIQCQGFTCKNIDPHDNRNRDNRNHDNRNWVTMVELSPGCIHSGGMSVTGLCTSLFHFKAVVWVWFANFQQFGQIKIAITDNTINKCMVLSVYHILLFCNSNN